jgi:predicted nucleic acid-binding protein
VSTAADRVAFVDTNVLVRHLTGDPPEQARRATAFLRGATSLVLADLVVAELVYVLESNYALPRMDVAQSARAAIAMPSVTVLDDDLLFRALELYEDPGLDFAEAYLAACAERTGIGAVASFDRGLDRVSSIRRIEPQPNNLMG